MVARHWSRLNGSLDGNLTFTVNGRLNDQFGPRCQDSRAAPVQEGVQMHGGVGMTDAFDIGFYMKRCRVLAEMFGDADYHADALARLDGY